MSDIMIPVDLPLCPEGEKLREELAKLNTIHVLVGAMICKRIIRFEELRQEKFFAETEKLLEKETP